MRKEAALKQREEIREKIGLSKVGGGGRYALALLPIALVMDTHFELVGPAMLVTIGLISISVLVAGRDFVRARRLNELLRAEREARAKSAQLAAIVESSDDPIISKTLEGVVVSWNAAAQRVFGYSAADVVGKRAEIFLTTEDWERERRILEQVVRGEFVEPFETRQRDKAGVWHDIAVTISPLRDATGNVIGISKIARDITERKRAGAVPSICGAAGSRSGARTRHQVAHRAVDARRGGDFRIHEGGSARESVARIVTDRISRAVRRH
jgi:PAS domain S-box-containing protein